MRGRLITIEGLDGSRQDDAGRGAGRRAARRGREWCCCASPAASSSPSASARWSRTRRWPSTRAPRRCSTPRRARSSWPSASSRCSTAARGCCSTASSTPRWPTRASGGGWGSRRCARSTTSAPAACAPTARCCCAPTAADARGTPGRARRGARPPRARGRRLLRGDRRAPTTRWRRPSRERFRVLDAGAEPAAVLRRGAGGAGRPGLASMAVLGRRGAIALTCAAALAVPAAALANAYDDTLSEYRQTGAVDGCKYTAEELAQAKAQTPKNIEDIAPGYPAQLAAAAEKRAKGCTKAEEKADEHVDRRGAGGATHRHGRRAPRRRTTEPARGRRPSRPRRRRSRPTRRRRRRRRPAPAPRRRRSPLRSRRPRTRAPASRSSSSPRCC